MIYSMDTNIVWSGLYNRDLAYGLREQERDINFITHNYRTRFTDESLDVISELQTSLDWGGEDYWDNPLNTFECDYPDILDPIQGLTWRWCYLCGGYEQDEFD